MRRLPVHGCFTCAKWTGDSCSVLTEPIGLAQNCWSWTNDPNWEKKVNEAVIYYERRLTEQVEKHQYAKQSGCPGCSHFGEEIDQGKEELAEAGKELRRILRKKKAKERKTKCKMKA